MCHHTVDGDIVRFTSLTRKNIYHVIIGGFMDVCNMVARVVWF